MNDFIDGDFFESLAHFSFGDMYTKQIEPSVSLLNQIFDNINKPTLFIESHRLGHLFQILTHFEDRKCRVIGHNSDLTLGQEIIKFIPNNVETLFLQNYNWIETEKIRSLPIGLERKRWFPEQKKQDVLRENLSVNSPMENLVYMNFNVETNPQRKQIYESIRDKKFVSIDMVGNGGDYIEYIKNLKKHKYIISPPGNGIDCHRNWEAIYMGCIPIVLDSHFCRNIYSNLPVLIVDNYDLIEHDFLEKNYDKIKTKQKNINQYKNYWLDKI